MYEHLCCHLRRGLIICCVCVSRASVKLFDLGVRTPGGRFLGVRYAGGVDFRRFRTPSLPIFGVILGLYTPAQNDEDVGLHRMFEIVRELQCSSAELIIRIR